MAKTRVGFGVAAGAVSLVTTMLLGGCSASEQGTESVGSSHEALTLGAPYRVRALDFTAFKDNDTLHEGNCGSGPVDSETTTDPNGGGCNVAFTKAGEWLEYSIQAASARKLSFVARMASGSTGKTLRLSLDGQNIGSSLTAPSSGWQAFADRTVADIQVAQGTHTLRVTFETGDTNFNYIDIVPGAASLPARIEAENYQRSFDSTVATNAGNGCNRNDGVDKETTSDAGGSCSVGWTTAGEWLEYDVKAPQAGLYDLTARLAAVVAGRPLQVSVDGTVVGSLTAPSLGWQSFEDRTLENVNLSAGAHVVRLTFVQGETNLNYLDITAHGSVVANAGFSLGAAVNYNAFVFQDLSVNPNVAGPVAAGRDINASSFGYNTSAAGSIGVLVGRNFTGNSGTVKRDLVYGNTLSLTNVGIQQGVSRKASPVDFVAEKSRLDAVTANLAKLTTSGTATIYSGGTSIDFNGIDPSLNVFTVAGAALASTDVLRFFVPSTSTVVVNVTGASPVFETTGMQLGGLSAGHLLWNFPTATTLRLAQTGFKGTLLAVNAAVTQTSSTLDGVLIAASLTGGDNGLTWVPFDGSLPTQCLDSADKDGDGTPNCQDNCDSDPAKTDPGICNCGVAETDSDNDKIPNCVDACDADAKNSVVGQCGCAPNFLASGTKCSDGPCGEGVCDGAGTCGTPASCAPEANGCTYKRFNNNWYWYCPGPATWDQAEARCRAQPGRTLVQITSRVENAFIAKLLGTSNAWLGANDRSAEGTWRWATSTSDDGSSFWLGGSGGTRAKETSFSNWLGGQPAVDDCAAMKAGTQNWLAADCGQASAYVCALGVGAPLIPKPLIPGAGPGNASSSGGRLCDLFPARFCGPQQKDAPTCKAASAAGLPATTAQFKAQLDACENAFKPGGGCTQGQPCAACTGAASIPPAGSTCPAFEAEEKGFCGLQNLKETGCTPGQNCCNVLTADPISTAFDSGAGVFSYVDDAFRGTAQPSYAGGQLVTSGGNPGSALSVNLGGIDNAAVNNMSGGWQTTFTLAAGSRVQVNFDYKLTQSPNYEANEYSEMLVSVDGTLWGAHMSTTDYVARITGDADGGPDVTTGWQTYSRNLGYFAAGTHTLRIGALNGSKSNTNEFTTLLIDNARVSTELSDCADPNDICAPVYDCTPCETPENTDVPNSGCDPNCNKLGVRRCGRPVAPTGANGLGSCASDAAFAGITPLCEQVEVCSDPLPPTVSDPRTTPGSDLTPQTVTGAELFTPSPVTPSINFPADPPCDTLPCPTGGFKSSAQPSKWCSYNVDGSPVPNRDVPPDTKQGTAGGGSPISFTFDPNISMDFQSHPLPFGFPNYNLTASASFKASVGFDIKPIPQLAIPILDALASVKADMCGASMSTSHLRVLDVLIPIEQYLPGDVKPPAHLNSDGTTTPGDVYCRQVVAKYTEAVNRVKKAYRDAIELRKQYVDRTATGGNLAKFPADFCSRFQSDAPPGFPTEACGTEPAAATINRFITYYENQIRDVLTPAFNNLKQGVLTNLGLSGNPPKPIIDPIPIVNKEERDTQVLLDITFALGPIPMKLEVEGFVGYGLRGQVDFKFFDGSSMEEDTDAPERLAFVRANATPYAFAGMSLFVGVGFGFNGFSVSAGVEGDVNFGTLDLDNYAGAGIAVRAIPDKRAFPQDVQDAATPAAVENKKVLFPPGGGKQYQFSFDFDYGSSIGVSDILKGSIAARVRIKVVFFSKTWRKVLFSFPGFNSPRIDLLKGGASLPIGSVDIPLWGTVQMPLPFTELARLPVPAPGADPLVSTAQEVDTTRVGELFYDGKCECSATGVACERDGECCNKPADSCFNDPLTPGKPTCQQCRQGRQTCNDVGDCCNNGAPAVNCVDDPSDGLSVKVCSCTPQAQFCREDANCCAGAHLCRVNPNRIFNPPDARFKECRVCVGNNEFCDGPDQCCNGFKCELSSKTCIPVVIQ